MEHSDLFSQPADVVEYVSSGDKSKEPVENPVFSDQQEPHTSHTKPASS